eukprot:g5786.t1
MENIKNNNINTMNKNNNDTMNKNSSSSSSSSSSSMTETAVTKKCQGKTRQPGLQLYKSAARNLREYQGVPSITAESLEKTMALLQLRPARLVAQGLASRKLLKAEDAMPDSSLDSSSDSSTNSDVEMDEKAITSDTSDSGGTISSSIDNSSSDDDSNESQYDLEAGDRKRPVHMALAAAGIKLRPRETRPLLLALGVRPHRLVKLGLVDREDLLRSRCATFGHAIGMVRGERRLPPAVASAAPQARSTAFTDPTDRPTDPTDPTYRPADRSIEPAATATSTKTTCSPSTTYLTDLLMTSAGPTTPTPPLPVLECTPTVDHSTATAARATERRELWSTGARQAVVVTLLTAVAVESVALRVTTAGLTTADQTTPTAPIEALECTPTTDQSTTGAARATERRE